MSRCTGEDQRRNTFGGNFPNRPLKLGRELCVAALGFKSGFPSVNPTDLKIRSNENSITDFLRQTSKSDLSLNLAIVVNPVPNFPFFLITNIQLSLSHGSFPFII